MANRNHKGNSPDRHTTAAAPPHASAGHSPARRWLKRFIGASAVASVVVLTQGLWDPLEESAVTLAAPLSAALNAWKGEQPRGTERLAVVKLDKASFIDRYRGREPLDRCELLKDLGQLARVPGIHTLAVDFDLSPIREPDPAQKRCQKTLNDLLLDKANVGRWILMRPTVPEQPEENRLAIKTWWSDMRAAGIAFAEVSVDTKRGWVRDHVPVYHPLPSMGLAVDQRLHGQPRSPEAAPVPATDHGEVHTISRPISFLALAGLFRSGEDSSLELKLDDACLQASNRPAGCAQMTTLLFGSGYTDLDRFATPVGKLDGVDLHAAIAACPTAGVNHLVLFGLEILFGALLLAPLFEWGWSQYFRTASGEAHREATMGPGRRRAHAPAPRRPAWLVRRMPTRPQAAYLWIFIILVLAALMFVALFVFGVVWSAMRECPVIEAPIAIVLGMFIEVAITQSIEVSSELQEEHEHATHGHAQAHAASPPRWRDPHVVFKLLLYLALLSAAITYLRHDWTWTGVSQLLHG